MRVRYRGLLIFKIISLFQLTQHRCIRSVRATRTYTLFHIVSIAITSKLFVSKIRSLIRIIFFPAPKDTYLEKNELSNTERIGTYHLYRMFKILKYDTA